MGCVAETKDLVLEDQKGCIRGYEEFKYLGVTIDKEDRQENHIKNRINKDRAVIAILNCGIDKNKLLIHYSIVSYGAQT